MSCMVVTTYHHALLPHRMSGEEKNLAIAHNQHYFKIEGATCNVNSVHAYSSTLKSYPVCGGTQPDRRKPQ